MIETEEKRGLTLSPGAQAEGGLRNILEERPRGLGGRDISMTQEGDLIVDGVDTLTILERTAEIFNTVFEPLMRNKKLVLPTAALLAMLAICGTASVYINDIKAVEGAQSVKIATEVLGRPIPSEWLEVFPSLVNSSRLDNLRFFDTSMEGLPDTTQVNGFTYRRFDDIIVAGLYPYWCPEDPAFFVDSFGRRIAEVDEWLWPVRVYQAPGTPDGAREGKEVAYYWKYRGEEFDVVTDEKGNVLYRETPESRWIKRLLDVNPSATILEEINSTKIEERVFCDRELNPIARKFDDGRILIKTRFKDVFNNSVDRYFWVEWENGDFTGKAFFIDSSEMQVGVRVSVVNERNEKTFKIIYPAKKVFETMGWAFNERELVDESGRPLFIDVPSNWLISGPTQKTFIGGFRRGDGKIVALAREESQDNNIRTFTREKLYVYPRIRYFDSQGRLYAYADTIGKPNIFVEQFNPGRNIFVIKKGEHSFGWFDLDSCSISYPDVIFLPDGRRAAKINLQDGKGQRHLWRVANGRGGFDEFTIKRGTVRGYEVKKIKPFSAMRGVVGSKANQTFNKVKQAINRFGESHITLRGL